MVKYPLAILVLSRGSYFTYMHTILKWEIFFSQNVPSYDKSSNPYDLVFVQPSISQAHFFKAPPITSFPYGDTIKLPESENYAKNIYPDVLKHLQQDHIPIIMAFHSGSKEVLKYLALLSRGFSF